MYLDPQEVVFRFQTGLNAKDLTVIDRYVADNFISHIPEVPSNKAIWKSQIEEQYRAYEEYYTSIENIYEDGDRVYIQRTDIYRQVAPFLGNPPDFVKYAMTTLESYKVRNGQILEVYPSTVIRYGRCE